MFLGLKIDGYNIENQLAWENGQLVTRGKSLSPTKIAVMPSMLPYAVGAGIWNWFVDTVADSGIGDFLRIEPGYQNNPFRLEFVMGYAPGPHRRPAGGSDQDVATVTGGPQGGNRHRNLPGIGAYVPIYRDEMRDWQGAQYRKKRKIQTPGGDAYTPTRDTFGRGIVVATTQEEAEEILSFKQKGDYWREGKSPVGFVYIDAKIARGDVLSKKEMESMANGKWNPYVDGSIKDPKIYMLENNQQLQDFCRDAGAVTKAEESPKTDTVYNVRDFERYMKILKPFSPEIQNGYAFGRN